MAGLAKAGSEAMMKALKHNRTLKELDISFNRIPVEGATFLASGLKENDVLQQLKVIKFACSSENKGKKV